MSEVATVIPSQLAAILEQPPLCVGEDRTQYDQLREMLINEIKPTTATEYLLAYDIIGAQWELLRLHGFKAGMINAYMLATMKSHTWRGRRNKDLLPAALSIFRSACTGDGKARKNLESWLETQNLTINDVAANAYEKNIAAQIQTAHMINATLLRREAAYAELERRRHNGRSLSVIDAQKRIAAPIIDGETLPIAPTQDDSHPASNPTDSSSTAPNGSDDYVRVP